MASFRLLSAMVLFTACSFGQTALPVGTVLPVRIDTALDSNKATVGQVISGTVIQDVPLASGTKLSAGTHVTGRVTEVDKSNTTSKLAFTFDRIHASSGELSILTSARAIASSVDVRSAMLPMTREDRPEWQWTTVQVGGDVVYGIADRVESAGKFVGRPVKGGVLVQVSAVPGSECSGKNGQAQALWVFSSSACGVYGFEEGLTIAPAGHSNPLRSIVLESPRRIQVEKGSGILLSIVSESQSVAEGSL
jgi:hypothetical protein